VLNVLLTDIKQVSQLIAAAAINYDLNRIETDLFLHCVLDMA
jgi:hypothetical protein